MAHICIYYLLKFYLIVYPTQGTEDEEDKLCRSQQTEKNVFSPLCLVWKTGRRTDKQAETSVYICMKESVSRSTGESVSWEELINSGPDIHA